MLQWSRVVVVQTNGIRAARPLSRRIASVGAWVALLSIIATTIATTSSGIPPNRPDVRTEGLRRALAEKLPEEGLAIAVVLREPEHRVTPLERREAISQRQSRVLGTIAANGFTIRHRFRSVSGFSGRASADAIARLAEHPEVEAIYIDGKVHASLQQGSPLVGAPTVHDWGVTGDGVAVAVIDSGIDTDHPFLASDLIAEECFCDDTLNPFTGCCPDGSARQSGAGAAEDDSGHGTKVSGIITSSQSTRLGVAPGAQIVALKALNSEGSGEFSDVTAALDWVLSEGIALGVKVVNVSIGDGIEHSSSSASPCSGSNTANAINQLHDAGVSVFAASGNEGFDNGIAFPACVANAISVGGSYDKSFSTVNWCVEGDCSQTLCTDYNVLADDFVCHSNSSSLLDFVAPNWRTVTTAIGGGTGVFSGTSASAPYASGLAALLYEVDPNLTPPQIKTLLAMGAPMSTNADNGLSFPRVRVDVGLASINVLCGDGFVDAGEQCDDGNASSGDCCDAACQLESSGSACSDGNACTTGETCDGTGSCDGGSAVVCNDGNPCTDDACSIFAGCIFTNNSAPCDDGDACTTGDQCSGGSCAATPLSCDDENICTDDSCDSWTGCINTPNSRPCEDGNACTYGETCSGGVCGPPIATVPCDDANPCTDDSCNPSTGCVWAPNTLPCDDGDACTNGDVCSGGSCLAGEALDCDDSDACTADACDEINGCTHTPIVSCAPGGIPATPSLTIWGALTMIVGMVAVAAIRLEASSSA